MTGRLLLIEGWSDRIEIQPKDLVVALTAESLQDLRDRQIAHVIPEQFGFNARLAHAEQRMWPAQLDWLEEAGKLIAADLPLQEVYAKHFPWSYGWPFKALIDRLIVANEECEAVLNAASGQTIAVHLYEDPQLEENEAEVFAGWPDGPRARRVIWREIGQERGVPVIVDTGIPVPPTGRGLRRVTQSLRKIGVIGRQHKPMSSTVSGSSVARIVFLQGGPDLDPLDAELRNRGCDCLLAEEDGAYAIRLRGTSGRGMRYSKKVRAVTWAMSDDALRELIARAESFLPRRLAEPVCRGLAAWLSVRVPRYLSMVASCRDLLEEVGAGAVVTSHIGSDLAAAFIGAAAALPKVQSVLIAHGDSPEVAPVWDLHELLPYKHYFVPNREFANYFRLRRTLLGRDAAQVHQGSNRWAEYRNWRRPPRPWLNRWDYWPPRPRRRSPLKLERKPAVVYIASWVPGQLRYLGKPDYTENTYHDVQIAICDALSSQTEISAVLKLYPTHRRNSAIERYLKRTRSPVQVSRTPMRYWFPRADAVIVDHPSTSLYQTILARVPALVLLFEGFQFRETALAEFEGQTAGFSTPAEAAALVASFLRRLPHARAEADAPSEVSDVAAEIIRLATGAPKLEASDEFRVPASVEPIGR